MKISNRNFKQFSLFILILIATSACIVYLFSKILKDKGIELPWYISAPSISGIYFGIYWLYDQYLWDLRIFRLFTGINSPNLNGRWKGYAKSSYDEFSSKHTMEVTISQTATHIKVRAEFGQSKSVSVNAGFEPSEIDGCDALFYFYRNEPDPDATGTMAMHEGSAKLTYDNKTKKLVGSYFSGRDRHNHGLIELKRIK